MSFSLKLFGGVSLTGETGPVTGPAVQRHRLALLVLLATSRNRAVSRDKLMAWLWPERETEPARRLLNQAVHAVRQALGAEAIVTAGEDLQLNAAVVHCDVAAFEEALAAEYPERAVGLYAGPFLDGFFLDGAPEFERWVERERDRLARACGKALEGLAEAAERGGNREQAVERWTARAAHDPFDSRVALRLMQALERAGNRAGALQHATLHRQLLRQELEIEPPPEIQALVDRLRREPSPAGLPSGRAPSRTADVPAPPGAGLEAPVAQPRRRRTLWYGAALLLALALGGAIRLAAGRAATGTASVASPAADEIARAVARELDRRQRGDTAGRRAMNRTRSLPAYELYLRGDDPTLLRSDSGARRALQYFTRAVELDSTYGAAWAGVARMTFRLGGSTGDMASRARARDASEAALRRALALDDSLAEAHALLGVMRARLYDHAGAEAHFRAALRLEPGRQRIREWYVKFLLLADRPVEALAEAERALALDSLSPSATAELARALAANDRCGEALVRLDRIAALDPPLLRAPGIAAYCHWRQGNPEEGIALLEGQGDEYGSGLLGYLYARAGRREDALRVQRELRERWQRSEVRAYGLAFVPTALGDRDEAFAWLERAYEDGSLGYHAGRIVALMDPPFVDLRDDPRMPALRARLGLQNR